VSAGDGVHGYVRAGREGKGCDAFPVVEQRITSRTVIMASVGASGEPDEAAVVGPVAAG
jgi:hypothetical protein